MRKKGREGLLKKVQVVSGKTAGIITRETAAIAKKAGDMPGVIKEKTVEAIVSTGKTLKIKRLKSDIKNWEKEKLDIFTKMGKVIFRLVEKRAKNIRQKKEIKDFLYQLRDCERETERIKEEIIEAQKRNKVQIVYHKALFNLSSKEKDVRLEAIKTLGKLGEKNVIPILAKRLGDPDSNIRQATAHIMHKIIDQAISIP